MIISIHIPKTGGKFFRTSLKNILQKDICFDYLDRPISHLYNNTDVPNIKPDCVTNTTKMIHGHFLFSKYKHLSNAQFITWLRDPLERLASHYHYWLREPDMQNDACRNLHNRKLTFEEFSLSSYIKNLQSFYLKDADLNTFEFIGITEEYEKSIKLFEKIYNLDLSYLEKEVINVNPIKEIKDKYKIDDDLRKKLFEYHQLDIQLYEQGKYNFDKLCTKYKI